MSTTNQQWRLARRPTGEPSADDFELVDVPIPDPGPDEVLVRTQYFSVDPYMRGRMRDDWAVGDPMVARSVGEVVESNHADFTPGDIVYGTLDWARYTVIDGHDLTPVDAEQAPITTRLGVLGMTGLTAYFGLLEVGQPKPGDTVIVSAAAGAVGSVVGQLARLGGCHVVGITGADEKATWLTEELGFDAAINYRTTTDLPAAIADACPRGVDVYFENVGGEISDAVLDHLNRYSRVAVCGKIALYNREDAPGDQPTGPRRMYQRTRTRVEGFIVSDFEPRFEDARDRLARWVRNDDLRYRETITEGLEHADEAFLGLFEGVNIGKQLVQVTDPSA
ncbi:MAG: NADP-dependent oxidoreductase [Halobacteriales archaeon]